MLKNKIGIKSYLFIRVSSIIYVVKVFGWKIVLHCSKFRGGSKINYESAKEKLLKITYWVLCLSLCLLSHFKLCVIKKGTFRIFFIFSFLVLDFLKGSKKDWKDLYLSVYSVLIVGLWETLVSHREFPSKSNLHRYFVCVTGVGTVKSLLQSLRSSAQVSERPSRSWLER